MCGAEDVVVGIDVSDAYGIADACQDASGAVRSCDGALRLLRVVRGFAAKYVDILDDDWQEAHAAIVAAWEDRGSVRRMHNALDCLRIQLRVADNAEAARGLHTRIATATRNRVVVSLGFGALFRACGRRGREVAVRTRAAQPTAGGVS